MKKIILTVSVVVIICATTAAILLFVVFPNSKDKKTILKVNQSLEYISDQQRINNKLPTENDFYTNFYFKNYPEEQQAGVYASAVRYMPYEKYFQLTYNLYKEKNKVGNSRCGTPGGALLFAPISITCNIFIQLGGQPVFK